MEASQAKQQLRKEIACIKKLQTKEDLSNWSAQIMEKIEQTSLFKQAYNLAVYYSLKGEVETDLWIEKWFTKKNLILPVVEGDDLIMVRYEGKESLRSGSFGIMEPVVTPDNIFPENNIDLVIVPGVAFDKSLNRMGRGRGFYDRLLSGLNVPKIGICFGFQFFDKIPAEEFDRKMDMVITEKDVIGIKE